MNRVLLTGRIVNEFNDKNTFDSWAYNTIAVKRDYKNREGIYECDFVPLTLVNQKMVMYAKNYIEKGDLVEVVGKFRTKKNKDNKTTYEVMVDDIKVSMKKTTNQANEEDNEEYQEQVEEQPKDAFDELLGNNPTLDDVNRAGNKLREATKNLTVADVFGDKPDIDDDILPF